MFKNKKGFTLIELLIVIAIIAILASVIFVALDPLKRFQDSRDAARYTDIESIAHAIELNQVDNGGAYILAVRDMTTGSFYMIVDGQGASAMTSGCDDNYDICEADVETDSSCVDLDSLVEGGYLGDVPFSASADVDWDHGESTNDEGTGYVLRKNDNGSITVQSCESENVDEIMIVR